MGFRAVWVLSLALSGCYLRHEAESVPVRPPPDAALRDAGVVSRRDGGDPPRPDAGERRDAGIRDGVHWELVPRSGWLQIPHELGCTVHDGGRVVVQVSIPFFDICDHGGPVEWELGDDGTVLVRSYVWRQQHLDPDACPGVTAIATRYLVLEASGGTLRAEMIDGSSPVSVEVVRPSMDPPPCSRSGGPGARCVRDCECAGELVCVPEAGDFVMCDGGQCGDPCNLQGDLLPAIYAPHLECPSAEACRSRGGLSAPTCGRDLDDGCLDDPMGCGPGTTCPPTGVTSECSWAIELNGRVRHECGSDADCSEGLFCVQHADGFRGCEVPCFTPEMSCPFMHLCQAPRWVCEWIGE